MPPKPGGDCRWDHEIAAAVARIELGGRFTAEELSQRLLDPEAAREQVAPLAWAAVDSVCGRRYDRLAKLVGPQGLCLRGMKGADCVQLTAAEVARCGVDPRRHEWSFDLGTDEPDAYRMTCAKGLQRFGVGDFLRPSSIQYNYFPPLGRGNNAAPVIARPARAFVEYHLIEQSPPRFRPWCSLWLVFDALDLPPNQRSCPNVSTERDASGQERLYLVELQLEYWGI